MSYRDYYSNGDPTHQYYTLALVNPPKADNTDEFPISYNETRNSPFLKDPQSYYASVVRFTCTTPLLPCLVPAVVNPITNETHYTVTMHHPGLNSGNPVRKSVFFQSLNPYISKDNNEYYYIYQPIQFINMVNAALAAAWADLATAIPDEGPFIAWNNNTSVGDMYVPYDYCRTPRQGAFYPTGYVSGAPSSSAVSATLTGSALANTLSINLTAGQGARYLVGDYVNLTGFGGNSRPAGTKPVPIIAIDGDLIRVSNGGSPFVAVSTVGTILANTPISIYMNASLYMLFSSFSAENQASVVNVSPRDGTHWKLLFAPTYEKVENNVYMGGTPEYQLPDYSPVGTAPSNSTPRLYITQQYSTLPMWNPVSSFVFITSVLPINPESISIPVTGDRTLLNGGNNSAIGTVLTDFEIPLDLGFENKPVINYTPSAEYRLVDLNGNAPLSTIQLSIGWRGRDGVFRPLNIGPNGFAQVKLLFRKKDFDGV
jgi:hypothetical protein